jgi:hypothetical protein
LKDNVSHARKEKLGMEKNALAKQDSLRLMENA